MSAGARVFVIANFIVLALSFVATIGVLAFEFTQAGVEWSALAAYYSHLFIFFPTFGILALIAFYVPALILVDLYWTHVPNGKFRFSLGYVAAILLSLMIGNVLAGGTGGLKSMFEIKPEVLQSDTGMPAGCSAEGSATACSRAPVLEALSSVRYHASKRTGMSSFVRACQADPLFGDQPERKLERYCFASQQLADADTCCKAQTAFADAVSELHEVEENRSITGLAHRLLLPFKVFFLLVVFMIALLLVIRHRTMEREYTPYLPKVQRGLIIGAFAMLVWPLMNQAFLQSSGLLYGTGYESTYRDVSPWILGAFLVWVLLIVFFFFRSYDRADKDMENLGRIGGIVGSVVAAANYQTIIDYAVRFAGSGATFWSLGGLFLVIVAALVYVVIQPHRSEVTLRK